MASRTKLHYVVQCIKHGSESTLWAGKQVKVSKPLNKRDRHNGGCPSCKAERIAAAREAASAS